MKKLEYHPDYIFYLLEDGTYAPRSHYIETYTHNSTKNHEETLAGYAKKIVDMEKDLKERGIIKGINSWKNISI